MLLKNLKIEYYNNTRSWMNGPIFHPYMKNWNDELARQRRHILLLIDNAPSHIVDEYSNINIQFLPPNTTSKIQPLDQGIIRSVKCAYRKTIQVQYCSCMRNYEEVKQIMQSFDFVVAEYPCCCLGRSQTRSDPDLLPYSWFHDLHTSTTRNTTRAP